MRFIFLLVIAVVAIVAGVVGSGFLTKEKPAPEPIVQEAPRSEPAVKADDVLVAKTNIPLGTKITDAMVDIQPWPHHLVLDGFILNGAGSSDVIGKVARAPLQAHEPFMKSKLANPNDPGFLAAGLPAGMRAITIATDAVSGVAGYVFPGDRVDVLFTHPVLHSSEEGHGGGSGGSPEITEVVAPNLRVLAVNVRDGAPPAASGASNAPAVTTPSSVTVEISDEMAQHIRLAEKQGSISLSLRSITDGDAGIPHPTHLADLSQVAAPAAPELGDDQSVRVVRGNIHGAFTVDKSINGYIVPMDSRTDTKPDAKNNNAAAAPAAN